MDDADEDDAADLAYKVVNAPLSLSLSFPPSLPPAVVQPVTRNAINTKAIAAIPLLRPLFLHRAGRRPRVATDHRMGERVSG